MTGALIDSATKREELPEYDEDIKCPSCNAVTMAGYGLAGGGFGPYTACVECGNIVTKSEEMPDDE